MDSPDPQTTTEYLVNLAKHQTVTLEIDSGKMTLQVQTPADSQRDTSMTFTTPTTSTGDNANQSSNQLFHCTLDTPPEANPYLELPNGSQEPITDVSPTDEGIIATQTAETLYAEVGYEPDDSLPSPVPTLEPENIEEDGICPDCHCAIVTTESRAICTGCGNWTHKEHWKAVSKKNTP